MGPTWWYCIDFCYMWVSFIVTWMIFYHNSLKVSHKMWCNSNVGQLINSTLEWVSKSGSGDKRLPHWKCNIKNLIFYGEDIENQQNIYLSGSSASHQNGIEKCTIKTVVAITWNTSMYTALIFPKDTFPLVFGQCKWTMM